MAKQSPKRTTATKKTSTKVDFEPNKVALAAATMAAVTLVLIVMMIYV